ncbi:MAG: hypothetical protein ACYC46_14350 [Acidobacteriaceae bacterium]
MSIEARDELLGRLDLMEQMVQQGRRTTQYWGWMFLLWGIGYLVAIGWVYSLPKPNLAWPVVMTLTAVVGGLIGRARRKGQPSTIKARALSGIWYATGCSIFIFAFGSALSVHGWQEPQAMLAGIEILLGLAHAASSITLKWRLQWIVALVWWACGVASFYVGASMLLPILLVATLIGNIGFGFYLMALEARDSKRLAHA